MYVILGATGHVGSAVAARLLDEGIGITVVTRDAGKAASWRERGAEAATLDIADSDALRAVFRKGRRAFLLNPPAPPDTDTDAREHRSFAAIVEALEGSGLEKLVVQSTYGAQPGRSIGDLTILYDFEQALARQPIPTTVLRAAYYMSNWDEMLEPARQGVLPSMLPADLAMPMVAPDDLGAAAARLLQEPPGQAGIHYVEGPAHYSAQDVADAFARSLGHDVRVEVTPYGAWEAGFRKLGFSAAAATSFANMIRVTIDDGPEKPPAPERGPTSLQAYIDALVARG